jgi:hypothetical protein
MAVSNLALSAPGTAPRAYARWPCLLISQLDRVAAHEPKLNRDVRYQPPVPGADGQQSESGPGACLAREGGPVCR